MIERVSPREVLVGCRRTLGLPVQGADRLDDVLLAGLLRRCAGILCPCSRATLRTTIADCTRGLLTDRAGLGDRVEDAVEALTAVGDLLELDHVVTEDANLRQSWVFAAPPGFVVRPSGTALLFGIVPDQEEFLPAGLAARVRHERFTRSIEARPGEDIAAELEAHGLQQLSEGTWLKCPSPEPAAKMRRRFEDRLARSPAGGRIENLTILDTAREITHYRGRWTPPTNHTGMFVGRRPQEFGAPIWCVVRLEDGTAKALVDLPDGSTRWRGCDAAWHLQMAIDHCRASPQRYRRTLENGGVRLQFFSPLPQWSRRRLAVVGKVLPPTRGLLAFWLERAEAPTEEKFLQQRLWLAPTEDSESE